MLIPQGYAAANLFFFMNITLSSIKNTIFYFYWKSLIQTALKILPPVYPRPG